MAPQPRFRSRSRLPSTNRGASRAPSEGAPPLDDVATSALTGPSRSGGRRTGGLTGAAPIGRCADGGGQAFGNGPGFDGGAAAPPRRRSPVFRSTGSGLRGAGGGRSAPRREGMAGMAERLDD